MQGAIPTQIDVLARERNNGARIQVQGCQWLKGRRAACHWAWRDMLTLFGVTPDPARVARDGPVITGGGVTAGIDFALTIAAELAGDAFAQAQAAAARLKEIA